MPFGRFTCDSGASQILPTRHDKVIELSQSESKRHTHVDPLVLAPLFRSSSLRPAFRGLRRFACRSSDSRRAGRQRCRTGSCSAGS